MSLFERYLTLWVALCIVAGVALGHLLPGLFHAIGSAELAHVNLPVAVLIWLMIIPMLLKVDFAAIAKVGRHWRGIGVTLFINWGVKPFSMAFLGWLFIGHFFRPWLPAGQIDSYIAGLILLAAAPCTAMVFVWSDLTDGEPDFTLTQVALNDSIMVVAFAPIVGLLLGSALCRRTFGADRGQQLLRTGGGGRHQHLRLLLRSSARHRGRCPDRGPGDAHGRPDRQCQQGLVRGGPEGKGRLAFACRS